MFTSIFALLLSLAGITQTATTVNPNAVYTLQWTHDGAMGAQFREYVDGAITINWKATDLTKSATPDANGDYTYSAQGTPLTPGTHLIAVAAYNSAGEQRSTPLSVNADWTTPPAAPGHITIIKIVVVTGGEE